MRHRMIAGKFDPLLVSALETMMNKPTDEDELNLQSRIFATTMEKMYNSTVPQQVIQTYEDLYEQVVDYVMKYNPHGGKQNVSC